MDKHFSRGPSTHIVAEKNRPFSDCLITTALPRGNMRSTNKLRASFQRCSRSQTFLAWTFNTHRGGEEQALFGLLDHDGTPSWKYAEYKQIASEFSKLQRLGFPRYHKPDVAIAYSFESNIASHPPGPSNTVRQY